MKLSTWFFTRGFYLDVPLSQLLLNVICFTFVHFSAPCWRKLSQFDCASCSFFCVFFFVYINPSQWHFLRRIGNGMDYTITSEKNFISLLCSQGGPYLFFFANLLPNDNVSYFFKSSHGYTILLSTLENFKDFPVIKWPKRCVHVFFRRRVDGAKRRQQRSHILFQCRWFCIFSTAEFLTIYELLFFPKIYFSEARVVLFYFLGRSRCKTMRMFSGKFPPMWFFLAKKRCDWALRHVFSGNWIMIYDDYWHLGSPMGRSTGRK